MAQRPVSVVVADDHRPFLDVAREVIAATAGFESAREVLTGLDAVAAVDELDPDLVLVDVHMPGLDGVEATRAIKRDHPSTVVALITAQDLGEVPDAARACGADVLIRKQDLGPSMLRRLWRRYGAQG